MQKMFTNTQIQLAATANALGHKSRIKIMELLGNYGKLRLNTLTELLGYSKSTVFGHLVVLQRARLIYTTKAEGKTSFYQISKVGKKNLEDLETFTSELLKSE